MQTSAQPLVTLALFAYNQEKFIAEAVNSVLSQDYTNLEIILSDDCSVDATFKIIKEISGLYSGSAKLVLNRNEENIGLADHFNKVLGMASGEIIIIAAGDDVSLKNRVRTTVEIFEAHPEVMLVSFDDHQINDSGFVISENICRNIKESSIVDIKDLLSYKAVKLSGASRGIRRSLYDTFGCLKASCPTEDTPYLLRALMSGKAYSCSLPGIYYRRHTKSLSSASSINYMDFVVISEQYEADALVARELGMVSSQTFDSILKWSDTTKKLRYIRKRIFEKNFTLVNYLAEVSVSKNFSAREKIKILKSVIRSYLF